MNAALHSSSALKSTTFAITTAIATVLTIHSACASDVTVQPAAGNGFVVKDAAGANERLRVQESGAITLPGVPAAATQSTSLCMSGAGLLGPCSGGGGSGSTYTASTGLNLTGTTFSVAPTYQLPQGCVANQVAQWNGSAWVCAAAQSGATLPVGTVNQTLRYDSTNALVANAKLQAFSDGGLLADGTGATGPIPASGPGTRLMWYPAQSALRVGKVSGTNWDSVNIGTASIAMGTDPYAFGANALAIGNQASAESDDAIAIGTSTRAKGQRAVALGTYSKAFGTLSVAIGGGFSGSTGGSVAIGAGAQAQDDSAFAFGSATVTPSLVLAGPNAIGIASYAIGAGTATFGDFSMALGSQATSGAPGIGSNQNYAGAFTYGDGSAPVVNTSKQSFMVLASGGTVFYSGSSGAQNTWPGVKLAANSGSWTNLSDRNVKTAIAPVDARAVLEKVIAMPLNTWQYKTQEAKYRHMGPMAQDFYAAFHLGETDKGIDTVDADGVALAAIQGLHALLKDKDAEISALRTELSEQKSEMTAQARNKDAQIAALLARVAVLESASGDIAEIKRQLAALRHPPGEPVVVALRP